MDIESLRTFLEVARTRHFGKAAEELCVTQSAVSARIRQLEQTMGVALFTRQRNNIQLASEGQQLRKHAETIVQVWARARQETGLRAEFTRGLAVGAMWDLWETLLRGWLLNMPRVSSGRCLPFTTALRTARAASARRLVSCRRA